MAGAIRQLESIRLEWNLPAASRRLRDSVAAAGGQVHANRIRIRAVAYGTVTKGLNNELQPTLTA
jgi:hypothetical protein